MGASFQLSGTEDLGSGTIGALNATAVAETQGSSSVTFNITGTWSATLIIEANTDGTNWFATQGFRETDSTVNSTLTANAAINVACSSFKQVRLRASLYTSGTANIAWDASAGSNATLIYNNTANSLLATVTGNIASAVTDSGNPIKVGGVYNSSLPTFSTGQRADLQLDSNGRIQTVNSFINTQFRNITGNATTVVKSGAGTLVGIQINNNSTGGTVTIYNNTAGSGTKIATLTIGSPSGGLLSTSGTPGPVLLGAVSVAFSIGLTVVTSGSGNNDVTAYYI